jgi:DNA (cytosine-5)-methyltransferase 1
VSQHRLTRVTHVVDNSPVPVFGEVTPIPHEGLTATDLFCGAGGSSLGAQSAGVKLVMAANHWATAIDVHQSHFPEAGHDLADVSQADPRRYPRTEILIAGAECTNHSQARGVSRKKQNPSLWDAPDPSAERSRATMWDVPRFTEQLGYDMIVVENVVEAAKWVGWRAWHVAMEDLGYEHEVLSLNSMHHGVPQSRDRIYVVFWRKGLRVDLSREDSAWCPRCERANPCRQAWKNGRRIGRYRQQWVWQCATCAAVVDPKARPAADIIDWSLPCPRIGDRARPLADKTRARILAGLQRYGWAPDPMVVSNNFGNVPTTVDEPLGTATTGNRHGLLTSGAFGLNTAHGGRIHDLADPYPTVCASDDRLSLVVPLRNHGVAMSTGGPVPTVTANGNHHALVMRNMTARGDGGQMSTPITEPIRTLTTTGNQSLLMPYYSNGRARPVGEGPSPTVSTRDRCALIDPERVVDDCGFRMLEPHEIAAAMAFPVGYIPGDLPKKHQVKLAGNAVTPPVMEFIMRRVVEALERAA